MAQVGGAEAAGDWMGIALSLRVMVQDGDGPSTFEADQETRVTPPTRTRLGAAVMERDGTPLLQKLPPVTTGQVAAVYPGFETVMVYVPAALMVRDIEAVVR